MDVKLSFLQALHQVEFRQPIFELPALSVAVLKAFYEKLNPRYPIAMSEMQSLGGVSYGEIALRVNLSSANALLEISPDKFTANFNRVFSETELKTVDDVIELAESALSVGLPDIDRLRRTLRVSSWLSCDGGKEAAQRLLMERGSAGLPLDVESFGATEIGYTLKSNIGNEQEGWRASFLVESSTFEQAHIFCSFETSFERGGKYHGLSSQDEFSQKLHKKVLSSLGLNYVGIAS